MKNEQLVNCFSDEVLEPAYRKRELQYLLPDARKLVEDSSSCKYKVMITQIINNRVVGKAVLVEDFDEVNKAINAANRYSKVYDRQMYQIRAYDEKQSNLISFDGHDTGKIVYEKK